MTPLTPLAFDIVLWTTATAALGAVLIAADLLIKHDDLTFGDVAAWFRRPRVPAGAWQRLRLRISLLRTGRQDGKGAHARAETV